MSTWGECYFDHYEKFLGEAASRQVFSLDGSPLKIQVLGYEGVVEGCVAYCSIGLTLFESAVSGIGELCAIVNGGHDEVPRLLANAELFMVERRMTIGWGTAIGGMNEIAPAFVAETGKEAIYITSAEGRFADGFETVHCGPRTGTLYLAVFLTKAEFAYFKKHGAEALEERMAESDADPSILTRPSFL